MPTVVRVCAMVVIAGFMFSIGLSAERMPTRKSFSDWGALAGGGVVSLVLIPAVGLLAVKLFGLRGPTAFGLILLSVAAGAPFAVKASETAGGSPRFAVALTLLLGALTVFTAPATASWALSVSVRSQIKPGAMVLPLIALQWLPIALGVLIRRRAPTAVKRIGRGMDMLTMALVVFLLATVIAPRLGKLIDIGWQGVLAALATALASWGLGWLGGGPAVSTRVPSAAIANARNIGLGLVLAEAAFPDDRDVKLAVASMWIIRTVAQLVMVAIARRGRRQHEEHGVEGLHPVG